MNIYRHWQALSYFGLAVLIVATEISAVAEEKLRIATFQIDATPPLGSPLPYSSTESITEPLTCRGIVLYANEAPIVLCAVDWLGIANDGNRTFREQIANACGTTIDRVAVHTLHQHDAPWCDFGADELAKQYGATGIIFDSVFARTVLNRICDAVREAKNHTNEVTHISTGQGVVHEVASNRRILGPDGKVASVRWTATKDPMVRAAPEGVIDPIVRSISFWNNDRRTVTLTYYATHPQSYYGKGHVNPDFPGMARNQRQKETGVQHIHFCGAGGNIGAGKYNDGSPENRPVLTQRLAEGMKRAFESESKVPVMAKSVQWRTVPLLMPAAKHLSETDLQQLLSDPQRSVKDKIYAATYLVWLKRTEANDPITIQSLSIGDVSVVHLPGELFVEYQLAAQQMATNRFVATAAYGDYAPCYIGTAIAYQQGGYETEPRSSLVAPECEPVILEGIQELLGLPKTPWPALGVDAAKAEIEFAKTLAK